ncbi:MAG TPA: cytochrome P450 [Caulobacteraceae bacterium]|nr:cytochrome P450 [Caulobacteraceae bacterium]
MSVIAMELREPAAPRGLLSGLKAWLARRRARREDAFGRIPRAAYVRPIHRVLTPVGPGFWLNDPAAVKRVMVDNVANYPKTALERRFFAAVFGDGLLSTDGDTWRAHRRIMAPSFDPRSVAAYAPVMASATEDFAARWDALAPNASVDMAAEMTALTLEIIAQTMFSTSSARLAGLINETVQSAQAAIDFNILDVAPVVGPARLKARDAKMRAIFAELDGALDRLICEREMTTGEAPGDLLGRLLAAKDNDTGAAMSAREVRDQVVTIFLAGHETTAAAMTWVWYLLARNPAEAARLHGELDAVLGGRTPTAEDVQRLPYTRMVIEEAMRLYPPAPGVSDRQARAPDMIAGARVPRGARVFINSWVLHRNPAWWPDPERFDPERFSAERVKARPRYAYMPFGAGPRVCIGAALALTEAALILAVLAQRYQPTLASDAPVRLQQRITLRPRGGLPMRLVRRGA